MVTTVPVAHGRINDLDSHPQVPVSRWREVFGDATAHFGERFAGIPLFDAIEPLGDAAVEASFVRNAELLLPA